jgi:hypothetical protein
MSDQTNCCAVFVAVFLGLVVRASRDSLSSLSGELLFVLVTFTIHKFSPLLRGRVSARREITRTPNTNKTSVCLYDPQELKQVLVLG